MERGRERKNIHVHVHMGTPARVLSHLLNSGRTNQIADLFFLLHNLSIKTGTRMATFGEREIRLAKWEKPGKGFWPEMGLR